MKRRLRISLPIALLVLLLVAAPTLFGQPVQPNEQPHGITATLAYYAERIIGAIGYPGVFLAMTAESMFLPVPSEAVMPFTGFLVADGYFRFEWVIIASVLGSIAGSLISYLIGAWGGKPFVDRLGKYVLLDRRDLESTQRFFDRRGEVTIFISRFIPVVRHLISLPAGAARMNLTRFLLFTAFGAGIWDTFLSVAGYYLRDNWAHIMRYGHTIDAVVVLLLVLLVAWYVYRHLRRRALDRKESAKPFPG
ncbi:MAG TPA: DedA family protein [Spirochaetia bacterium]|nr:DedA family protein [Spirochaetia bacterium]